ncbi:hypothetical protein [Spartinivicinus ruber]|uniref:hypothetical protein n=1 Tax=Spartinivicinus ruber TaxID=2683272 RepID=UPI0013D82FC4|nr:hypothetical protein [Spartinivicinus ruber]
MAKKKKKDKEPKITALDYLTLISETLRIQDTMELKRFLEDGSVETFIVRRAD